MILYRCGCFANIILSIYALCFATVCEAQDSPGVRNAHSMVYHENEKAVYLFGGATDSEVKNDLWKWQNGVWSIIDTAGPAPRTFASMLYDSDKQRILLFGGSKVLFGNGPNPNNLLNDTWIYQEGAWTEMVANNAPPRRAESAGVYDKAKHRAVIFGGYEIRGKSYVPVADTWEFWNESWKKLEGQGPSKRNNAAMAFDENKNVAVLFGGSTGRGGYGDGRGETWTLAEDGWSKMTLVQPPNIFNAAMVYTLDGIIRFGGWDGQFRINETWLLTDDHWKLIETANAPSSRNHSAMVYDRDNDQIMLYGGHDGKNIFGDLWRYRSGVWEMMAEVPQKPRIANGH